MATVFRRYPDFALSLEICSYLTSCDYLIVVILDVLCEGPDCSDAHQSFRRLVKSLETEKYDWLELFEVLQDLAEDVNDCAEHAQSSCD